MFGALGKIPSKPAQSLILTGRHSPSLCHALIICRVRATEEISQLAGISIKPSCFSPSPYPLQNHSESVFTGYRQ